MIGLLISATNTAIERMQPSPTPAKTDPNNVVSMTAPTTARSNVARRTPNGEDFDSNWPSDRRLQTSNIATPVTIRIPDTTPLGISVSTGENTTPTRRITVAAETPVNRVRPP